MILLIQKQNAINTNESNLIGMICLIKNMHYHNASQPVMTKDTSFDVSTLNDS